MTENLKFKSKRIVVKVGSNVLTNKHRLLDKERINHLVSQLSKLSEEGADVIVVSSGAVAVGREILPDIQKNHTVEARQLFAATGQVKLMNTWSGYFENHGKLVAQVLITKEDFKGRQQYLNIKGCMETLLKNKVI